MTERPTELAAPQPPNSPSPPGESDHISLNARTDLRDFTGLRE